MVLKDQSTDITTDSEICPHYIDKGMYPCGVKEMTALDPKLFEEAQPVRIRWFQKILKRLLKLQALFASSATGNVQPPVSA